LLDAGYKLRVWGIDMMLGAGYWIKN